MAQRVLDKGILAKEKYNFSRIFLSGNPDDIRSWVFREQLCGNFDKFSMILICKNR